MGAKLKKLTEKLKLIKGRLGKKSQMVVVLILSLVMLIIFFNGLGDDKKTTDITTSKNSETPGTDYVSSLENRMEKILQNLSTISSCEVFIMTETSSRVVYAVDEKKEESMSSGEKKDTSSSTEIVFNKGGSTQTPIVSVEIYPEIVGVLVVAECSGDEKTRLMIINAISVALNVSNSKIEVLLTHDA